MNTVIKYLTLAKYGTKKALELYEEHIRSTPELYNSLDELHGKDLGCWCHPQLCHLIFYLNY